MKFKYHVGRVLVLGLLCLGTFSIGIETGLAQISNQETKAIGLTRDTIDKSKTMGTKTIEYLFLDDKHKEIKINDEDEQSNLINRVIILLTRIVGTFGVLAFVTGGFFMIIANGDEQKISKGKNMMLISSIGLIIAFTSYIIVAYVLSIVYSL